jgi:hypothetical protein
MARCSVETGCTQYQNLRFVAECEPVQDKWSLRVRTAGTPKIFVSNPIFLPHELAHVRDFIFLVETHVSKIKVRSFPSEAACQVDASALMSRFPSTMRDVAHQTTAWRDGVANAQKHFPRANQRAAKPQ